jgi:hypothetical protein
VHLSEVQKNQAHNLKKWAKTTLGKNLASHYKKLIFVITGHGLPKYGVNISWDSLLDLVTLLETKCDEIFIHLDTCFSGNAANEWVQNVGNNVKIITASSCPNKKTNYDGDYLYHNNHIQLFSGYYLHVNGLENKAGNTNINKFKKLKCDATIFDVVKLSANDDCVNKEWCNQTHIYKGKDEKLKDWNLLPIHLAIVKHEEKSNWQSIEFPSRLCPFTKEPFHHHKKINLDLTVNALGAVNELDPVEAWKIRTYITTYHPVPIELQQEVPIF